MLDRAALVHQERARRNDQACRRRAQRSSRTSGRSRRTTRSVPWFYGKKRQMLLQGKSLSPCIVLAMHPGFSAETWAKPAVASQTHTHMALWPTLRFPPVTILPPPEAQPSKLSKLSESEVRALALGEDPLRGRGLLLRPAHAAQAQQLQARLLPRHAAREERGDRKKKKEALLGVFVGTEGVKNQKSIARSLEKRGKRLKMH